jgi:transposase-like protein
VTDAPRTSKPRRRFTPEARAETLAVLKANGGNIKKTARETGVAESTVRVWRDAPDRAAPAETRLSAESDLATAVDAVRWKYLDRANEDGAVKQTSGYYAVQAFQKLTESHQLLTGKPTQRIEATPWGQLVAEIRDMRKAELTVIEGGKSEAAG